MLKRRKSDGDGSMAEEAARDVELQDRSPDRFNTNLIDLENDIGIKLEESEPITIKQSPQLMEPKVTRLNPLAP